MRLKNLFLCSIITVVALAACDESYPCARIDLNFRLIGFSDAEADTIIVRRFQKNTSVLIDTVQFDPANPIRFNRFGDTLVLSSFLGSAVMNCDNDYQYYFPGAAKTISITGIVNPQVFGRGSDRTACGSIATSCKVDGQTTTVQFPNFIYLKK